MSIIAGGPKISTGAALQRYGPYGALMLCLFASWVTTMERYSRLDKLQGTGQYVDLRQELLWLKREDPFGFRECVAIAGLAPSKILKEMAPVLLKCRKLLDDYDHDHPAKRKHRKK